jgi:hypothetical protein
MTEKKSFIILTAGRRNFQRFARKKDGQVHQKSQSANHLVQSVSYIFFSSSLTFLTNKFKCLTLRTE